MTLLVTLFLVLINIFTNITSNSPNVEGLTSISAWVIACILFVFGALIGYAGILIKKKILVLVNFYWIFSVFRWVKLIAKLQGALWCRVLCIAQENDNNLTCFASTVISQGKEIPYDHFTINCHQRENKCFQRLVYHCIQQMQLESI